MYSSRLRLAVITTIVALNYTVAEANALKGIAKKALPVFISATMLFAPVPHNALSNDNTPSQRPVPQSHHAKVLAQGIVDRAVFFEQHGVGQRGIVRANDGHQVKITRTLGPEEDGQEEFDSIMLPLVQVEAALKWDYHVSGNFVVFVPETTEGLETQRINLPTKVNISSTGQLEIGVEEVEEKIVALGTITAVADDGRYLIKPYHFAPLAPEPHDWHGATADEQRMHREVSSSPLKMKHHHDLNTDLYLVAEENVISGLERIVIEETEISPQLFANFAHNNHILPAYTADDFADEII